MGAEAKHAPGPWTVVPYGDGGSLVVHAGYDWRVCFMSTPGDSPNAMERIEANARLIATAPDHALVGWAMCVQDATWDEWGENRGGFCFAGLCHVTKLDEFGVPVLTPRLRSLLTEERARSAALSAAEGK